MIEISKADWKLFRSRLAEWQERYMDRLNKEYIELLSGDGDAADKFWELEKRIKRDKKRPGVILELHKQDMVFDLVALINDGVIDIDELEGFSEDVMEIVNFILKR